jgi:hypothetical protein
VQNTLPLPCRRNFWLLAAGLSFALTGQAERINQEGRLLGPAPVVTNVLLFNTTNADAVVSALQILPLTNPWNEDISRRPLLVNSAAMIAQITNDLAASRQTLRLFKEMNFVLVPDDQPLRPVDFLDYPDESDLNGGTFPVGQYPVPDTLPIETWPSETGGQTLDQWQQNDDGSDRHAIMVQPGTGRLFETWRTVRTGTNWSAANGAMFNLNTNALRPAGWTSGDAAGLPMFPALVRFDECERGMVEHAMRLVVKRTRYGTNLYPATHYAAPGTNTSANLPKMGQRLRLKSAFVINPAWTLEEKAVLLGLKKYGALVADNGNFFSISVTPDDRWPAGCFDHLSTIGITNFEVVQATGPTEGPRSPGAPTVNAGVDQTVITGLTAMLAGTVTFSNLAPAVQWTLYAGPGTATFGDAQQTNTTVTFGGPGQYTLLLSADDGVHAVARDAVVITVAPAIALKLQPAGSELELTWTGGTAPFVVERSPGLSPAAWTPWTTSNVPDVSLPLDAARAFFRVRGQ